MINNADIFFSRKAEHDFFPLLYGAENFFFKSSDPLEKSNSAALSFMISRPQHILVHFTFSSVAPKLSKIVHLYKRNQG